MHWNLSSMSCFCLSPKENVYLFSLRNSTTLWDSIGGVRKHLHRTVSPSSYSNKLEPCARPVRVEGPGRVNCVAWGVYISYTAFLLSAYKKWRLSSMFCCLPEFVPSEGGLGGGLVGCGAPLQMIPSVTALVLVEHCFALSCLRRWGGWAAPCPGLLSPVHASRPSMMWSDAPSASIRQRPGRLPAPPTGHALFSSPITEPLSILC